MKRYFASFLVLFALAASAHAQNCSAPVPSSLYNFTQTPPTPPVVKALGFPDVVPCNGQNVDDTYTVQVFERDSCQNTLTNSVYAQSTRTTFGVGIAICSWSMLFGSINDMCDPRLEDSATTATSPTDYNRFYIRAYDAIEVNYNCGNPTSLSRQDFWQCQGVACTPNCGCCSGPVGAELLETPQKKDVKFRGKAQTSCFYDCPCCQPACSPASPIMIDLTGAGFFLTDAAHGVLFDIKDTGKPLQVAWTAPSAQNAFLCLPDANGSCDDGKDLFGNFTPQPPSSTPNGFAALAVYDQPANGGNGDGIIDSRDAIFSSLRLWIDANHDGISQPGELFTLPSLGVNSISLNYKWDQRTDQYGNIFRYRAQVGSTSGAGRMAYDVFLVIQTSNAVTAQSCPAVQLPRLLPEGKDGLLH
jgi:hypothetical protein